MRKKVNFIDLAVCLGEAPGALANKIKKKVYYYKAWQNLDMVSINKIHVLIYLLYNYENSCEWSRKRLLKNEDIEGLLPKWPHLKDLGNCLAFTRYTLSKLHLHLLKIIKCVLILIVLFIVLLSMYFNSVLIILSMKKRKFQSFLK